MKKMYTTLFAAILLCAVTTLSAQDTLVFQPGGEEGKDARIETRSPNQPYPTHDELTMSTWTAQGSLTNTRGLLDISFGLPPQAVILYAKITLYPDYSTGNQNGYPINGNNEFWVYRVTQPWLEDSVTWNTQPSYDSVFAVNVPQVSSGTQQVEIDITSMIIDKFLNPSGNHGMLFRVENESSYYRGIIFGSSDNANPAIRPRLTIVYMLPTDTPEQESIFNFNAAFLPGHGIHFYANQMMDNAEFKLYDMNGKLVSSLSGNGIFKGKMPGSDQLTPGLYILNSQCDQGLFRDKVMVY